MSARRFVDTNIWIYAHLEVPHDPRCEIAARLVEGMAASVSTQVLGEYYNVMVRNKMDDVWIQQNVEAIIAYCAVHAVTVDTVRVAHHIKQRYKFSYWDSLIVAAALTARCDVLYSEDLKHQQYLEEGIEIINPFSSPA